MRLTSKLPYRWLVTCAAALLTLSWLVTLPAKETRLSTTDEPLPEGLQLVPSKTPIDLVGSMKTLNERLSQALPPGDNAVNFLMIVFGPDALEPELKADSYELLGLKKLPDNSPLFVSLDQYTKTLDGIPPEQTPERASEIQAEMFEAGGKLWKRDQYPQLAGYLDANADALKMTAMAVRKPGYYAPMLSVESPPRLLSAALNIERRLPFLARMFAARALLHLENNQFAPCIDDLITCHQMAFLLAYGSPFDVSGAKAHVIDSFAFQAEAACLNSGKLRGDHLNTFASRFRSLTPLPTADRAIDIGERAIVHQEIELLSTDGESVDGFFEKAEMAPKVRPDLGKLDWQTALKEADKTWDQIVQALRERNRDEQHKLFTALSQKHEQWEQGDDADVGKFLELLKKDPTAASRSVGLDMAMSLRPLWWQRQLTDERARTRRDLINLGIAALLCREATGSFPTTLQELAPKYIDVVPSEAHSDGSYTYTRLSDGRVQILSTGPNRQNDANQDYNDDQFVILR